MALPKQLSEKQLAVLDWIREGCPADVYDDDGYMHRISARALERRGLVTISGHGNDWKVELTEAGTNWRPDEHQEDAPQQRKRTNQRRRPKPSLPAAPPTPSQAELLMEKAIEAGGRLPLPDDRRYGEYQELVRQSLRAPNRPCGQKLEIVRVGAGWSGPYEIRFTEHIDDLVQPEPVPLPEHVGKYSSVVRAYLDNKNWHCVSGELLSRAARILEAIVREAPKRGITVLAGGAEAGAQSAWKSAKYHVSLQVGEAIYHLQIREISKPGGGRVTRPAWDAHNKPPTWTYERISTFIPSGRLELVVRGPFAAYNGDQFRDAKTVRVEDKLPQVFRSLEIYRREAEAAEANRRRQEQERQRQWQAAMAKAKELYLQDARWKHFEHVSKEWQAVNAHRDFLAAARAALVAYEGDDKAAIEAELGEAELTLDEIDPIRRLDLILPELPDPKPEDLQPFLGGGRSPYGPNW